MATQKETMIELLGSEELADKVSDKLNAVNCPMEENTSLSKILLTQSAQIHAVIMGRDVELEYGEWLDNHKPSLDEETQQSLDSIRGYDFKDQVEAKKKKAEISHKLAKFPTKPGIWYVTDRSEWTGHQIV